MNPLSFILFLSFLTLHLILSLLSFPSLSLSLSLSLFVSSSSFSSTPLSSTIFPSAIEPTFLPSFTTSIKNAKATTKIQSTKIQFKQKCKDPRKSTKQIEQQKQTQIINGETTFTIQPLTPSLLSSLSSLPSSSSPTHFTPLLSSLISATIYTNTTFLITQSSTTITTGENNNNNNEKGYEPILKGRIVGPSIIPIQIEPILFEGLKEEGNEKEMPIRAWLASYTVYDIGSYILTLRITHLLTPSSLHPLPLLETIYEGTVDVVTDGVEAVEIQRYCSRGDEKGRWLRMEKEGEKKINERIIDEHGYSQVYGDDEYYWQPLDCYYHSYTQSELFQCAASCNYEHINIVGDNTARELFEQLHQQLTWKTKEEFMRDLDAITSGELVAFLQVEEKVGQYYEYNYHPMVPPYLKQSLLLSFNAPLKSNNNNTDTTILTSSSPPPINALIYSSSLLSSLESDLFSNDESGLINWKVEEFMRTKQNELEKVAEEICQKNSQDGNYTVDYPCIYIGQPKVQHENKFIALEQEKLQALESLSSSSSSSSLPTCVLSSLSSSALTPSLVSSFSSHFISSALSLNYNLLDSEMITSTRWEASIDGYHYSENCETNSCQTIEEEEEEEDKEGERKRKGWTQSSVNQPWLYSPSCNSVEPNKCNREKGKAKTPYQRKWQGGVAAQLSQIILNQLCNQQCNPSFTQRTLSLLNSTGSPLFTTLPHMQPTASPYSVIHSNPSPSDSDSESGFTYSLPNTFTVKLPLSDLSDKERIEREEKWLRDGKSEFDKMEVIVYGPNWRGVEAKEKIEVNETVLFVPYHQLLSRSYVLSTPLGRRLLSTPLRSASTPLFFSAFLLYELAFNPHSYWIPYFAILPLQFSMSILFNEQEWNELKGSMVQELSRNYMIEILQDYNNLITYLPEFRRFSLSDYIWSRLACESRYFEYAVHSQDEEFMSPHADMPNHDEKTGIEWKYDNDREGFKFVANKVVEKGDTLTISYGSKCNSRFLTYYGFNLEENGSNGAHIRIALSTLSPSDSASPSSASKLTLLLDHYAPITPVNVPISMESPDGILYVRGCEIGMDPSESETSECLSSLRILVASDVELAEIEDKKDELDVGNIFGPISLENELEMIKLMGIAAKDALGLFHTSWTQDNEILAKAKKVADQAASKDKSKEELELEGVLSWNQRCAVVQRRGEKEVLHWWNSVSHTFQVLAGLAPTTMEIAKQAPGFDIAQMYLKHVLHLIITDYDDGGGDGGEGKEDNQDEVGEGKQQEQQLKQKGQSEEPRKHDEL